MELLSLPLDVTWHIMRFLSVQDVVTCQMTCRCLYEVLAESSVWYNALVDILRNQPYPHISKKLHAMSTEQLRTCAVRLSSVEHKWHKEGHRPSAIRYIQCSSSVRQAELLPGGDLMLLLLDEGTLQLTSIMGDLAPTAEVKHCSRSPYVRCKVFTTSALETLVLLRIAAPADAQAGDDLYLYLLDTVRPAFKEISHVVASGLTQYTVAGNLFVYSCITDTDEDLVFVKSIPELSESTGDVGSVVLNLGTELSCQDFLLLPLKKDRLLISHTLGLSLYEIPSLANTAQHPGSPIPIVPIWQTFFRLQHALRHASPIVWNEEEGGHVGSVMIMGINTMHMFASEPEPGYRRSLDCRLFFTPPQYCVFGSYHALWDHGRTKVTRLGSEVIQAGIVVKTCTLPRRTEGSKGWSQPLLGSMIIPVQPEEVAVHASLDEASGRFSLVLSKGYGDRRIAIVAVVDV